MNRIRTILLAMVLCNGQSFAQTIRSFSLFTMAGWKFQCANTTCSPSITTTVSKLQQCALTCLAQIQCEAISFHQLTSSCELFTDIPNPYGNLLAEEGFFTMIVISGTRIPPALIITSTTTTTTTATTTSATTTSTTTTSTSSSISTSTSVTTATTATTITTTTTTTTTSVTTTTTTACSSLFLNQVAYSIGPNSNPNSIAISDLNNDNKLDIIIANYDKVNISVLLNVGDGTFLNATTYSTGIGGTASAVVIADVNNDDKPDAIVANHFGSNVAVLLNVGNGTFSAPTMYSTGSTANTWSVAVGDLNGDNKTDIVAGNAALNNIAILLNVGDGTFLSPTTYSTGSGSGVWSVAIGDLNGDNRLDIVVANYDTNNVGVFLNAGSGIFSAQTTYSTGSASGPWSAMIGEVNNDNRPDIIVTNSRTNEFGVFMNTGTGTFLNQMTYSTGTGSTPYTVVVADLNNDNKSDIVVSTYSTENIGIFLNTGNGSFVSHTTLFPSNGSRPFSVAVADVNNDNKPDVIAMYQRTNTVGVYLHC